MLKPCLSTTWTASVACIKKSESSVRSYNLKEQYIGIEVVQALANTHFISTNVFNVHTIAPLK